MSAGSERDLASGFAEVESDDIAVVEAREGVELAEAWGSTLGPAYPSRNGSDCGVSTKGLGGMEVEMEVPSGREKWKGEMT